MDTSVQPVIKRQGNTGVKGVLADYAARKETFRVESEIAQWKKSWELKQQAMRRKNVNREIGTQHEEKLEDLDEDEQFMDDDEFFEEYKKKRMQQIQNAQMFDIITSRFTACRSTFGFVQPLSQAGFVGCIDNEKSDVFVVIHLYQDVSQLTFI